MEIREDDGHETSWCLFEAELRCCGTVSSRSKVYLEIYSLGKETPDARTILSLNEAAIHTEHLGISLTVGGERCLSRLKMLRM